MGCITARRFASIWATRASVKLSSPFRSTMASYLWFPARRSCVCHGGSVPRPGCARIGRVASRQSVTDGKMDTGRTALHSAWPSRISGL
jgi:hypothetical protein